MASSTKAIPGPEAIINDMFTCDHNNNRLISLRIYKNPVVLFLKCQRRSGGGGAELPGGQVFTHMNPTGGKTF